MVKTNSMKKNSLFFVALFWGFCFVAKAQNGLGITRYTFSSITSFFGDSIDFSGTIRNYDTIAYSSQINFGTIVNAQQVQGLLPSFSGGAIINPQDTISFSVKFRASDVYFQSGPNVVIIWPIANKPAKDSVIQTLNLSWKVDIAELAELDVSLKWQTKSSIIIDGEDKNKLKHVRILDLNGREMKQYNTDEIHFDFLSQGVYLLEVIDDDNKRKVIRFAYYP